MVKVGDFLTQNEVFQELWPPRPNGQRVLVIRNGESLIGR
mgnify:CR=1 FL=1